MKLQNIVYVLTVGGALLTSCSDFLDTESPSVQSSTVTFENDGVGLVAQIVELYQTYDYKTQVLAASIRNTLHILQCAEVGADVVTCPLSAIKGLLNHPLTDIGLEKFLADYKKVNG